MLVSLIQRRGDPSSGGFRILLPAGLGADRRLGWGLAVDQLMRFSLTWLRFRSDGG